VKVRKGDAVVKREEKIERKEEGDEVSE